MQVQNCRCKLQVFWGVLRKRLGLGARTRGSFKVLMLGQMAPFYLLWNMGAFCTCKMQLQGKLQQFWASCASPLPLVFFGSFSQTPL